MFARLRQRPLDLYLAYRALANTWVFMPFQVLYLEQRGLQLSTIFDLNVAFTLACVLFEVPTGIYADRRGRRKAMALGGVVMTVACLVFIASPGVWGYALANVLFALSMTLASGADSAWLYDHLEGEKRRRAERFKADPTKRPPPPPDYSSLEGYSTAAKGIGNLLAVLVCTPFFAIAPWSVFVLTGVITAASSVVALALPSEEHVARDGSYRRDLARATQIIAKHGRIAAILAFGAITFVLFRIPLFADQPHLEVHLTELTLTRLALAASLLQAGKEIGGIGFSFTAGRVIKTLKPFVVVPAVAVVVLGTYATMGLGFAVPDILLMVFLSSLFGLFSPLMRTLMNEAIPSSRDRATLLSFESMGRRVLFAAASPLFGRAVESSSLHATFTGTAWVALVLYATLGAYAITTPPLPLSRERTEEGPTSITSYID